MTHDDASFNHLQAVVFDWAGTVIDHGCRAPARVFQQIFESVGVPISEQQSREPMGLGKSEHIAAILAMDDVATRWREKFGQPPSDTDVQRLYADFIPLQKRVLLEHCDLIPGAAEIARTLRASGLRIGSTTGYTRELLEVIASAAQEQGFTPECAVTSDDVAAGRPAPFMLFRAAELLRVYPMSTLVKVDDTAVGIRAGRNAGCWTVGVTRTGNFVGLSETDWLGLDRAARQERLAGAKEALLCAGAHAIVESVADLSPVLDEFERLLASGLSPD